MTDFSLTTRRCSVKESHHPRRIWGKPDIRGRRIPTGLEPRELQWSDFSPPEPGKSSHSDRRPSDSLAKY